MPKFNPTYTPEELQTEEWRAVAGYEGLYEVSNLGRVKALKDRPIYRRGATIRKRIEDKDGYCRLDLSCNGKRRHFRVCRLVAFAFLSPPSAPDKIFCNHKDGNKSNDRVGNLEWVTDQENRDHARKTGLMASGDRTGARLHPERMPRGENHGKAKLTNADLKQIWQWISEGEPDRVIAQRSGVSKQQIWRIRTKKNWKHVHLSGQ